MRLLFIANSPTLMSPSTDALNSILKANKEDEIFVLYLGHHDLEEENNIKYIHYECDLDNIKLSFLIKGKHFIKWLKYFFKKVSNKITYNFKQYNKYELKALGSKAIELIFKYDFDRVVVFESFSRERSMLIKKYLKNTNIKKLIYWLEMPIKKDGNFDSKYFSKISKLCYKSCVHSRYNDLVSLLSNKDNIVNVEYPITTLNYIESNSEVGKYFIYFGKMYKTIRNPEYLFNLMKQFSDYKLLVYGAGEHFDNAPLNVVFNNPKPLKDLYETISKSSGLICIENSVETARKTSKLATYIPFKKPIIDIVQNESIECSLDLNDYKYGFVKISESDSLEINTEKLRSVLANKKDSGKDVFNYKEMYPESILDQFKKL